MSRPIGRRAKRGQSLVEFALILPVLLVLTIGVVDAARIFTSWVALNSGVGEAALYATNPDKVSNWCTDPATDPGSITCPPGTDASLSAACGGTTGNWCPNSDNIAYRLQVEASGLDRSRIAMVDPTCTDNATPPVIVACNSTAAFITIGASYQMDLIMPVVSSLMGSPIRMSAAATAPIIPTGP